MPGGEATERSRNSRSRSPDDRPRKNFNFNSNPYNMMGRTQHPNSHRPGKNSRGSGDHYRGRRGSGKKNFRSDNGWDRRGSGGYRERKIEYNGNGGAKRDEKEEARSSLKPHTSEGERRDVSSHQNSVVRDQSPSRAVKREDGHPTSSAYPPRHASHSPPPSEPLKREPELPIPKEEEVEEKAGINDTDGVWARQKINTGPTPSAFNACRTLERPKEEPEDVLMACDVDQAPEEPQKAEMEDGVRAQDAERASWERQKAEMEERVRAHNDDRAAWESQKAEMEARLRTHEAERESWAQERITAEAAVTSLRDDLSKRDADIERLEARNDLLGNRAFEWEGHTHDAKKRLAEREAHDQHQESKIELLEDRLRKMEHELAQMKKLLEARTEENKVAQAFMTTADQYSIADVSGMVDLLNNEIFQCAMDMSDVILQCREAGPTYTAAEDEAWKPNFEHACRKAADIWTPQAVSHLQEGIEKGETILFDCLVQKVFVDRCREVIQSFCPENNEIDEYMEEVWRRILNSHEMPISKKWLAIANKAFGSQPIEFHNDKIVRQLRHLLVVAGWRPTPDNAAFQDMVTAKISGIIEKAVKVKEMISEGVLSANVEVFCFVMGETYDPLQMQDAYDTPGRNPTPECSDKEPIVCTTGLGLRCTVGRAGAATERWRQEIVLKAKVVTQSTLTS